MTVLLEGESGHRDSHPEGKGSPKAQKLRDATDSPSESLEGLLAS